MEEIIDPKVRQQNRRIISAMTTAEFDEEIESLTVQLNEKIYTLRKDYRDLKIFQNTEDIDSARNKLIIFVKKLIDDTTKLIRQIGADFEKSRNKMDGKKEIEGNGVNLKIEEEDNTGSSFESDEDEEQVDDYLKGTQIDKLEAADDDDGKD